VNLIGKLLIGNRIHVTLSIISPKIYDPVLTRFTWNRHAFKKICFAFVETCWLDATCLWILTIWSAVGIDLLHHNILQIFTAKAVT